MRWVQGMNVISCQHGAGQSSGVYALAGLELLMEYVSSQKMTLNMKMVHDRAIGEGATKLGEAH